MRQIQIAGLLVLVALCGCRSSDRTILLEDSLLTVEPFRFETSFTAVTFSSDGSLMAGFSQSAELIEVRDVSTGTLVGSFASLAGQWFPILFSADNTSLVLFIENSNGIESAVLPVTGSRAPPTTRAHIPENGAALGGFNYDFTLHALSDGAVIFRDGGLVAVEGAEGSPFFDQYGTVWYRTPEGWASVGRDKTVTSGVDRPGYLVEEQTMYRGAMRLYGEKTTMEMNEAEAYVSAVWLDHDKAAAIEVNEHGEAVSDRTALVYVGADVFHIAFVPNRKLISVLTNQGTALVPYVVEPRGEEEPSDR